MFQKWIDNIVETYEILTDSEDYQRRVRLSHEKSGALRSGEGTEAEIFEKLRKLEERKKFKKMLDNK
jgi:hypothetical protein